MITIFEALSKRLTPSHSLQLQLTTLATTLALTAFLATTAQTILISPLEARETDAQSTVNRTSF